MPSYLNWNIIRKKKKRKQEKTKAKRKAYWNQGKNWVNPKKHYLWICQNIVKPHVRFCSPFGVIYLTLAQQMSLTTQALNLWSHSWLRGKRSILFSGLLAAHWLSPTRTSSPSFPFPSPHSPSRTKQYTDDLEAGHLGSVLLGLNNLPLIKAVTGLSFLFCKTGENIRPSWQVSQQAWCMWKRNTNTLCKHGYCLF